MQAGTALLAAWIAGTAPLLADDSDPANQLTLADLAAYRVALSGKPTADDARAADPPISASFRDLWDRAGAFKGRRVAVKGRIERIFRQGAVGQFPALVQSWAYSRSGDPFCLVYPDSEKAGTSAEGRVPGPVPGKDIQFSGTFLKIVEYPAGDGPRLAPLIVGDRPPEPSKAEPMAGPAKAPSGSGLPDDRILALLAALAVVGILAARHLRPAGSVRRASRPAASDPPLEFIPSESRPETQGDS